MIKVGVLGSAGRMGETVCDAVSGDDELELVARVDENDPLTTLADSGAQVAVDFTTPDAVKNNVRFCLENGIHAVVGTTGLSDADLDEIGAWAESSDANAFVAPNFALGAVLMMRFAAEAAQFYDHAEIIERHHERKLDAPSGTALRTAALMRDGEPATGSDPSRGLFHGGVAIHSVRLPGSVAHQEVIFGAPGETLTIKHDSIDRVSFMPGVLIAIKKVASKPGLTVGLEHLLDR
jgi:4-hydroxy-tetrahydrodipicolinate reductase